jgi:CheY-like chemotaxis protein
MRNPVVLCVDDDPGMCEFYQAMLSGIGYEPILASDGHQALNVCQFRRNLDLVILDLEMPGMDGNQLAERIKMLDPLLPVMMVSGSNPELMEISPCIDAAIMKGVPIRNILNQIVLLLEKREAVASSLAELSSVS